MAAKGFVLLDGGLATELEGAGHDLNDPLWSAKVLLDDPEAVAAVHRAFLEAGADCITTATYQATFQGLARRGMTRAQAEDVFLRAVDLAVRVRDEFWSEAPGSVRACRPRPLVAASVGPYGAFLADGSEYRGGYGIDAAALDDFHRRRWQLLAASDADLIAAETLPCLDEARVLARLAAETRAKPAWLSFCCRDRGLLADGDASVAQAGAVAADSPSVFATGVNCTAPAHVPAAVTALAAATTKPVLALPQRRRRLRRNREALERARRPVRLGRSVPKLGAGRRRGRGRVLSRESLRDPTHGRRPGRRRPAGFDRA